MTAENSRAWSACLFLFLALAVATAASGCTSSVQEGGPASRATYLDAYCQGVDHHLAAQDYFNNATYAWESLDFRQAIADYANASMEYDAAMTCYDIMKKYSADAGERAFAEDLRGCARNLSLASNDFLNAAIALKANDTGTAYGRFNDGQARMDASDALLGHSVGLVPAWLNESLASG